MGIRFYCPNGHRLHVKQFQAGKRGICPHCEARFRIPRESMIPAGSPRLRSNGRGNSVAVGELREEPAAASLSVAEPLGASAVVQAATARAGDVIEEAPGAMWYVRPPSGGQFGPALGDVLLRWVAEGRVSADTLVWRDGWPAWRPAGPLFENLPATASPDGLSEASSASLPLEAPNLAAPAVSANPGVTASLPRKPPPRSKPSPALIVTLGILVLALLVALILVLRGAL